MSLQLTPTRNLAADPNVSEGPSGPRRNRSRMTSGGDVETRDREKGETME